jgi:hypothetical protein
VIADFDIELYGGTAAVSVSIGPGIGVLQWINWKRKLNSKVDPEQ